MKIYYKIFLIILLISLFPLSAVHAESIKDNTYLVYIWTPVSSPLNPRWVDQFEFDAGDVFRAYTTQYAQLSGTWIETELVDSIPFSLTWFQAFVEQEEEPSTTTTTVPEEPELFSENIKTTQKARYDINIWGLAFIFRISLIDPTGAPLTIGFSIMTGYGGYLGADATFWGLAGITGSGGGGGTPAFGSISPDSGAKESTLTAVEITGENTTFQDDGVNSIIFSPDDGLTISNITVQNNTTVEFDLEISPSASTGLRSVIVTYDNFSKVITGESVFEVTE